MNEIIREEIKRLVKRMTKEMTKWTTERMVKRMPKEIAQRDDDKNGQANDIGDCSNNQLWHDNRRATVANNTNELLFTLPVLSSSAVMSTLIPFFQLASDLLIYMLLSGVLGLCCFPLASSSLFPIWQQQSSPMFYPGGVW